MTRLRPGDWLMIAAGLAATVATTAAQWGRAAPTLLRCASTAASSPKFR